MCVHEDAYVWEGLESGSQAIKITKVCEDSLSRAN